MSCTKYGPPCAPMCFICKHSANYDRQYRSETLRSRAEPEPRWTPAASACDMACSVRAGINNKIFNVVDNWLEGFGLEFS